MTPELIHGKVRLKLNEINSNIYENLLPEELDIALNESLLNLISAKENENFSTLLFDDFEIYQELITEITLSAYFNNNNNKITAILPPRCFRLLNIEHNINCNYKEIKTTSVNKYVYLLELENLPNTGGILYNGFFIFITGISTIFTKPTNAIYYNFEDLYRLKNLILEDTTGIEVYDEYYNGKHYPNKLVFVSDTPIDLYYSSQPQGVVQITLHETIPLLKIDLDNHKTADGRLVSFKNISIIKNNVFQKTNKKSVLNTLNKNVLTSYHDKKFIPIDFTVTYIEKPRKIDLSLYRSFNLTNDKAIEKIIDSTVERLSIINNNSNAQNINNFNNTQIQKEKNNII